MKKRILFIALFTVILPATAYLGAGYLVYDRLSKVGPTSAETLANTPENFAVTYPEWSSFDPVPYQMSNYDEVRFASRQAGISLAGWYIESDPSAPVVIVTHGIGASKADANVLIPAGMLSRNGFNVLIYDLRNHGESDRDNGRTSIGNKEYQDVLGAWDWLVQAKGFSSKRIGLYGVSLGGGTTLMAFGEEPRVAAAFVDSPFADLPEIMNEELSRNHYPTFLSTSAILMARLAGGDDLLAHSPTEAITNDAGRPLYLVHGTGDTRIDVHHTRQLAELAAQNGANVTVWLPEGVPHVAGIFVFAEEYERRLVDFFDSALR